MTHNPERCIGCWMCIIVYPYGVIGREWERRIALKRDRCPDREVPACVEACPTRALILWGEEFAHMSRREAAEEVAQSYRVVP